MDSQISTAAQSSAPGILGGSPARISFDVREVSGGFVVNLGWAKYPMTGEHVAKDKEEVQSIIAKFLAL